MVRVEGVYRNLERIGQEILLDDRGFEIILGRGNRDDLIYVIDKNTDLSLFIHHVSWALNRGLKGYTFVNLKPSTLLNYFGTIVSFVKGKVVVELREDLLEDEELKKIRRLREEFPFLLSFDSSIPDPEKLAFIQPNFVKINVKAFRSFSDLRKYLGIRTVLIAKKVENERIFRMIRMAGIEFWQGWYEKELMSRRVFAV